MKCRNEPVARGPDGRKVREVVATLNGVALPTGTDPESQPSAAPSHEEQAYGQEG